MTNDDVDWLISMIEVLEFKVTNLTTERDVANQEIDRLKLSVAGLEAENRELRKPFDDAIAAVRKVLESQLTTAKAEIERLKKFLVGDEIEKLKELITTIPSAKEELDSIYSELDATNDVLTAANAKVEKLENGIRKVLDYHSVELPASAEMALSSLLSGPGDTSKQEQARADQQQRMK